MWNPVPAGDPCLGSHNVSRRLAAPHPSGGLAVYEPWSNPRAETGADLLQLDGRVRSIEIYTREPRLQRLGSIDDPRQVRRLVHLVLASPVRPRAFGDGATATLGFLLEDGTAVARTVHLESGVMNGGIIVSGEALELIKQARRR